MGRSRMSRGAADRLNRNDLRNENARGLYYARCDSLISNREHPQWRLGRMAPKTVKIGCVGSSWEES